MPKKACAPGGLSRGMKPSDFDPAQLAIGVKVELEHTCDRRLARKIAMDHLVEDELYYQKLARIEANRSTRPRIVDAEDIARNMRVTFADRAVETRYEFNFSWPLVMHNVGDSLAVAYASDKWKPKDASGRREVELYKHLAESRNRVLVAPGLLFDEKSHEPWPVIGPMVSLAGVPLPRHFAILGLCLEINLCLHTRGTDEDPRFAPGRNHDEGVVAVQFGHAMLAGSMLRWSVDGGTDEPFIFIYTESDGILCIITGDELRIEKDGIAG